MIKIFDGSCIQITPVEDGFAAVFQGEDSEGHPDLLFKRVSVLDDTARDIDKEYFKLLKFGFNYGELKPQIDNYLLTVCKPFGKQLQFTVTPDGIAKILDKFGNPINQANLQYSSFAPCDIAIGTDVVWASYPERNTAVRYNLSTLRQELRIGGQQSKVLHAPNGLYLEKQQLYICNAADNKILSLDTVNFTVEEYLSFKEPVYQYIKVDGFNIVRLKSGVYRV